MKQLDLRRIVASREFVSAVILMAIGGAGYVASQAHPMGSAARMGPGYLPRVLCLGLLTIGIAMAGKAALFGRTTLERIPLRGMLLVTAGLLSFAALMEWAGLIFALPCLVVVAAAAGREFRMFEALILGICLTAACIVLFVHLLDLPLPVIRNG